MFSNTKIHPRFPQTPTQMKTRKKHMQPSFSQIACPRESGHVHQNKGANQEKQTRDQVLSSTQGVKGKPRGKGRHSGSTNGRWAESCWVLRKHILFLRKAEWGKVPKPSKSRALLTAKRADVTWKRVYNERILSSLAMNHTFKCRYQQF